MSFQIIGITGFSYDEADIRRVAGAGKDTAADWLVERHGFVKIGLADPLKRICKEVYNFTDDQLWGPSQFREAPDMRYPRPGEAAERARIAFAAIQRRVQEALKDGREVEAVNLGKDAVTFGAAGWLTPRYALQQLGTEWGRDCYGNTWIDYAVRIANALATGIYAYDQVEGVKLLDGRRTPPKGVVYSDIRFFNEHVALSLAGAKVVRVKRKVIGLFTTATDNNHTSERQLSTWEDDKFHYVIDNCGSKEALYNHVDRMLDVFNGRLIPFDEAQKDIPPFMRK